MAYTSLGRGGIASFAGADGGSCRRGPTAIMIERPLPRLSTIKAIVMVASAVLVPASVGLIAVHYQSYILVFVSVLVLIATISGLCYLYFHRRRCPKCGGLLSFREELIGDTKQSRCLLDCMSCQITWDTGEKFDDDDAA